MQKWTIVLCSFLQKHSFLRNVDFEKMVQQQSKNERKEMVLHDFRNKPVTHSSPASPPDT